MFLKLLRSPNSSSGLIFLGSNTKYCPRSSYCFSMLLCISRSFSNCSRAVATKLYSDQLRNITSTGHHRWGINMWKTSLLFRAVMYHYACITCNTLFSCIKVQKYGQNPCLRMNFKLYSGPWTGQSIPTNTKRNPKSICWSCEGYSHFLNKFVLFILGRGESLNVLLQILDLLPHLIQIFLECLCRDYKKRRDLFWFKMNYLRKMANLDLEDMIIWKSLITEA